MGIFSESCNDILVEAFNQEPYETQMSKSPRGNSIWFEFQDEKEKTYMMRFDMAVKSMGKDVRLVKITTKDDIDDRRSSNLKFTNPMRVMVTMADCLEQYLKTPYGRSAKGIGLTFTKANIKRGARFMRNLFARSTILKRFSFLDAQIALKNGKQAVFCVRKGMEKDIEKIFTGEEVGGLLGTGNSEEKTDWADKVKEAEKILRKNPIFTAVKGKLFPTGDLNLNVLIGKTVWTSANFQDFEDAEAIADTIDSYMGEDLGFYNEIIAKAAQAYTFDFKESEYGSFVYSAFGTYWTVTLEADMSGSTQISKAILSDDNGETVSEETLSLDVSKDLAIVQGLCQSADDGDGEGEEDSGSDSVSDEDWTARGKRLKAAGAPFASGVLASAAPAYDKGIRTLRKTLSDDEIADALTMNSWDFDSMRAKLKSALSGFGETIAFKETRSGEFVFARDAMIQKDTFYFKLISDSGLMRAEWRVLKEKGEESIYIGDHLHEFHNAVIMLQNQLMQAVKEVGEEFDPNFIEDFEIDTRTSNILRTTGSEAIYNIHSDNDEYEATLDTDRTIDALDSYDDFKKRARWTMEDLWDIYGSKEETVGSDETSDGARTVSSTQEISGDGVFTVDISPSGSDISDKFAKIIQNSNQLQFSANRNIVDLTKISFDGFSHEFVGELKMPLEEFKDTGGMGYLFHVDRRGLPFAVTGVTVEDGSVVGVTGTVYSYTDDNR